MNSKVPLGIKHSYCELNVNFLKGCYVYLVTCIRFLSSNSLAKLNVEDENGTAAGLERLREFAHNLLEYQVRVQFRQT